MNVFVCSNKELLGVEDVNAVIGPVLAELHSTLPPVFRVKCRPTLDNWVEGGVYDSEHFRVGFIAVDSENPGDYIENAVTKASELMSSLLGG